MPEPAPVADLTAPPSDRRTCARHHYRRGPALRYLVRPGQERGEGRLRELSAEGAGLLMAAPPEPGSVLLLQLGAPQGNHSRLALVLHSQVDRSGKWLVGCRFTPPLSADELAALAERYARYE